MALRLPGRARPGNYQRGNRHAAVAPPRVVGGANVAPPKRRRSTTMTETATATVSTAVDNYLRFWNAGPGEEQRQLATTVFNPEVDHHGPLGVRVGPDALVELSKQFTENLGHLGFQARIDPEVMGDRARLKWEILRD